MRLSLDLLQPSRVFGMEDVFRMTKEAGFDRVTIDYNEFGDVRTILGDNYIREAEEMKELMDRYGLECFQAHAPIKFREGSPAAMKFGEPMELTNPHYRDVVRSIESASVIGAKQIVVHGVMVPDGKDSDQIFEYNYEYYKSLEPYAEKFGLRIGVENLTLSGVFYKPEYINRIYRMLDSDRFYILVDVGHAVMAGFKIEEFLERIENKKAIHGIHLHDHNGVQDHFIPALGTSDWGKITKVLADMGYGDDLDMELPNYLKKFPPELYPFALKLAEQDGRRIIRMIGR